MLKYRLKPSTIPASSFFFYKVLLKTLHKQGPSMNTKRTLSLDVGDRTVGVAISDLLGMTAQPVKTIRYKGEHELKKVFTELLEIMKSNDVGEVLVGMPLNMNGTEGPRTKKTEIFLESFQNFIKKKNLDLDTWAWTTWDERLSTVGAERVLLEADVSRSKRKNVIDKMAAVFILQGYLESKRDDVPFYDEEEID